MDAPLNPARAMFAHATPGNSKHPHIVLMTVDDMSFDTIEILPMPGA